jgi:hypothetical protein
LHAIVVKIKNVGTTPIWQPSVFIDFKKHFPNRNQEIGRIKDINDGSSAAGALALVIESQETVVSFANQNVTDKAFAVTYSVRVSANRNLEWFSAKTVTNKA